MELVDWPETSRSFFALNVPDGSKITRWTLLPSIFESAGCAFDPRRGTCFFMESPMPEEKIVYLLLARLERISADSYWAHRASGVRGALIRIMEESEAQV